MIVHSGFTQVCHYSCFLNDMWCNGLITCGVTVHAGGALLLFSPARDALGEQKGRLRQGRLVQVRRCTTSQTLSLKVPLQCLRFSKCTRPLTFQICVCVCVSDETITPCTCQDATEANYGDDTGVSRIRNAYLLVYIRECDIDQVLHGVYVCVRVCTGVSGGSVCLYVYT